MTAPSGRWYTPTEPEDFAAYDGPHEADPGTLLPRAIAACVCGWHPSNHPGFWLADHLRDMNPPVPITDQRVAEIVAAMNTYDATHPLPNRWERVAGEFPEYDSATERLTDCDRFLLTDGTEIVWDQKQAPPQWQAERPEAQS